MAFKSREITGTRTPSREVVLLERVADSRATLLRPGGGCAASPDGAPPSSVARRTLSGVVSAFHDFEDEQDDDGTLDKATVEAIRRGSSNIPDVEAAERLVDQVAGLMVAVATGGPRIDDVKGQYAREYKALSAVLKATGDGEPQQRLGPVDVVRQVDERRQAQRWLGTASDLHRGYVLAPARRVEGVC